MSRRRSSPMRRTARSSPSTSSAKRCPAALSAFRAPRRDIERRREDVDGAGHRHRRRSVRLAQLPRAARRGRRIDLRLLARQTRHAGRHRIEDVEEVESSGSRREERQSRHGVDAGYGGDAGMSDMGGMHSASASWITRSTDGGKTWSPRVRVDLGEACPCCRTGLATGEGRHPVHVVASRLLRAAFATSSSRGPTTTERRGARRYACTPTTGSSTPARTPVRRSRRTTTARCT